MADPFLPARPILPAVVRCQYYQYGMAFAGRSGHALHRVTIEHATYGSPAGISVDRDRRPRSCPAAWRAAAGAAPPPGSTEVQNQRPRVVEQHLTRHAAESCERALDPGKPAVLLLVPERANMQPAGITQRAAAASRPRCSSSSIGTVSRTNASRRAEASTSPCS